MEKRRLGQSQIHTSPLCLGGNVFGWTLDEAASFRILDEFVAAGFDFIDTADVYSTWVPGHVGGESESIIGRWLRLRGNRSKIILATKVGWLMPPDGKGLSRAYILRAVEDSLRRLQTDYIDLYQIHGFDPITPLEETLRALDNPVERGYVRYIGCSNLFAWHIMKALCRGRGHATDGRSARGIDRARSARLGTATQTGHERHRRCQNPGAAGRQPGRLAAYAGRRERTGARIPALDGAAAQHPTQIIEAARYIY
jgi:aryl-alcohol dehydrogenase-like predicted oxidoreductase